MTTALVAGALANKPGNGGAAWTRLSWALGLRCLGFDVHFVEALHHPGDARAIEWFTGITDAWTLPATLLDHDEHTLAGAAIDELEEIADEAALLVNISGHLESRRITDRIQCRVYVDLDPGYTQLWLEQGLLRRAPHEHWYTVGTTIGTSRCPLPTGAVPWRPVLQPTLLDEWPAISPRDLERLTTVAAWRGPLGAMELGGRLVGPKVHEFRRFASLPRHITPRCEVALEIDDADTDDREMLVANGWSLADPHVVAGDPWSFRAYVQGSDAEWSVAQGMYVATQCGWVSDRTARYLASGRPAIVQDTGQRHTLPVGEGLVVFEDLDDAIAAIAEVACNYERHCRAARALAVEHFAAGRVLGRICEEVGVAP
jgi:hypothetical protein